MGWIRRVVLVLTVSIPAFAAAGQETDTSVIIGAIRWDWATGGNVNRVVEQTLGPQHWHYRVPFYGEILNDSTVSATCISQDCIDREILYAKEKGLDYFAYLLYEEGDPMTIPLNRYLSSGYKTELNFAVIGPTEVSRVIRYFKEPSYQKVLDGRPLYFIYKNERDEDHSVELKAACSAEGLPEPYIVVMHQEQTMPGVWDFDAITRYWYGAHVWGGSKSGAPYSTLAAAALGDWTARAGNGAVQVPLVPAGADGRPRVETETPWVDDPSFYEYYYENPTPGELAGLLGDAMDFVRSHPVSCESRAILIYAWNENDEGGWLTPTLDENGQADAARLQAIKSLVSPTDSGSAAAGDASLKALLVNQDTVNGFHPDSMYYHVELPYGSMDVPVITALTNRRYAGVRLTLPSSNEGTASVRVTSEDCSAERTYYLFLHPSWVPPESTGWEFNRDGDTEGWTSVWPGHASIYTEDSILVVNVTDNYPELISPANLALNASTYDKVRIRVRNNTASSEWYFGFYDSGGQRTFYPFAGISTMDTSFREYTFSLGGIGAWKGLIDRIEVLPARKVATGTVDIDYIRMLRIDGPLSDEARLSDLRVNGSTVEGFSPDSHFYQVMLPAGTLNLPVVDAEAENPGAVLKITQSRELNGSAGIRVISQSGVFQETYQVGFELAGYGMTHDHFDFEDDSLPDAWESVVTGYTASVENGMLILRAEKTSGEDGYSLNEINFRNFDLHPWVSFAYQSDTVLIIGIRIVSEGGTISREEQFVLPAASGWTVYTCNLAVLAGEEWGPHLDRITLVIEPASADYRGSLYIDELTIGHCPAGTVFPLLVDQPAELMVDLGPDTTITSPSYVLDAGTSGAAYLWNTGEDTQSIEADSSGTYYVKVITPDHCTASDTVKLSFRAADGVGDAVAESLYVYPNPCEGHFYLHLGEDVEGREKLVSLIQISGQLAYRELFVKSGKDLEISVPRLAPGFYFLKVETREKTWVKKLVIR